ncbi:hypothetical protein M409DRAFT_19304 [Zasmidium cellare ATCC 36951]|uniref:Uncharacterized protein n=1 Tax=Zasmidium cellare ATCC 36951 TaxID=1080233 RepID=A0A6A6CUU0_ZASCE|nr:uncharacterized protein M409DRAFT_19304 [Zasmidium cellare ATCC 36951]KAF2170483.1 hypothetical protein M409DRAFT_19304 [Zasmidium cellare ATCC 36951]
MAQNVNHQHPMNQPGNPVNDMFAQYVQMGKSALTRDDQPMADFALKSLQELSVKRDLFRLYWGIADPKGRDLQSAYPTGLRAPPGTPLPEVEPSQSLEEAGIQLPTHAPQIPGYQPSPAAGGQRQPRAPRPQHSQQLPQQPRPVVAPSGTNVAQPPQQPLQQPRQQPLQQAPQQPRLGGASSGINVAQSPQNPQQPRLGVVSSGINVAQQMGPAGCDGNAPTPLKMPFNATAKASASKALSNEVPKKQPTAPRGFGAVPIALAPRGGRQSSVRRPPMAIDEFPIGGTPDEKRIFYESHKIMLRCARCCAYNLQCDHDCLRPGGCSDCRAAGATCAIKFAQEHDRKQCKFTDNCYQLHEEDMDIFDQLALTFKYVYEPVYWDWTPIPYLQRPPHPKIKGRHMADGELPPPGLMLPYSYHNKHGTLDTHLADKWYYEQWDPEFLRRNERAIQSFRNALRLCKNDPDQILALKAEPTVKTQYTDTKSIPSHPHQYRAPVSQAGQTTVALPKQQEDAGQGQHPSAQSQSSVSAEGAGLATQTQPVASGGLMGGLSGPSTPPTFSPLKKSRSPSAFVRSYGGIADEDTLTSSIPPFGNPGLGRSRKSTSTGATPFLSSINRFSAFSSPYASLHSDDDQFALPDFADRFALLEVADPKTAITSEQEEAIIASHAAAAPAAPSSSPAGGAAVPVIADNTADAKQEQAKADLAEREKAKSDLADLQNSLGD